MEILLLNHVFFCELQVVSALKPPKSDVDTTHKPKQDASHCGLRHMPQSLLFFLFHPVSIIRGVSRGWLAGLGQFDVDSVEVAESGNNNRVVCRLLARSRLMRTNHLVRCSRFGYFGRIERWNAIGICTIQDGSSTMVSQSCMSARNLTGLRSASGLTHRSCVQRRTRGVQFPSPMVAIA